MRTELPPRFPFGRRRHAATPTETRADGDPASSVPVEERQMRRALPILAAWLAFYAIAVIGCLSADRQRTAERASTTTAAAATTGAR